MIYMIEDDEEDDRVTDKRQIRRALISVYDKTGLADLARGLHEAGVAIVSEPEDLLVALVPPRVEREAAAVEEEEIPVEAEVVGEPTSEE